MPNAGDIVVVLTSSALVIAAVMAFVLLRVRRTGRVDVIDTVWGGTFAAIATVGLGVTWQSDDNALRLLLTVLTVVWGVRLALHIGLRNRGAQEDKRYAELFDRHDGPRIRVAAAWVCLPQAAGLWFISLPVQLAQTSTASPDIFAAAGVAVWLVGMAFETGGDFQLERFRADPANRGRVLDTGFWRYTRHPNYFGDACVWWGLYLVACTSSIAAFAVTSPIAMTWLLVRGTGKPLMERHLADRPDYAEYVRRTSGFLPLPRRQ